MAQSSSATGITGALDTTLPIAMTVGAFSAIAWFNSVQLNVLIWVTFKRRRGLYFYSLLAASWGIIIYQLAFMAKFFQFWKNNYVSCTFITLGWYCMVTGQSLVLFSRLHLVVRDARKLKWILYMIIVDVFLFHFPTTVFTFGANSNQSAKFTPMYEIMEKVQVTAFCIQEFIISSVYVYETKRILKPSDYFQRDRTRRVMRHLIYVNLVLILMDIVLLCTEYANLYEIQIAFKGALYSVKLLLEFAILNQLIAIASADLTHAESGESVPRGSHVRLSARRPSNTITRQTRQEFDFRTFDGNGLPSSDASAGTMSPVEPKVNGNKSYSAFIGKGASMKPRTTDVENRGVVKTTVVEVRRSSLSLETREEDENPILKEQKEVKDAE